jgi:hypothetical protein
VIDTFSGFDYLGAEPVKSKPQLSVTRTTLALVAGAIGAYFVPKHPVLAFLNAGALASNLHAVSAGERTKTDAIKRMGRHIVATAGALAMPSHPAIGYIAGAIAGDLLIDGEGGGIIDEWAEYEGVKNTKRADVIDAEYTEAQPNQTLVKR